LVPADAPDIRNQYEILLSELERFNPQLLDKQRIVAISKSDLLDEELKAEMKAELDDQFHDVPYLFISAAAQQGLVELKDALWMALNSEA
jgi:GTP-binding protein